ncbi:sulfate adenylyltransferase subunit CysN [Rhodoblastus sphagnicola]|uniref:Sulfate adenylyltransferase subunit 1 n=1 Tax=Rhodoblastus sphagnicola TaxID=333368 RepID=A0A2S6MZX8_9HYPH|nr:sulfate adenylyltransferase subunit CysN [Rhodoblastus sphagnicola]MBB4197922.1 sulfate adenylyltransferase large subunit [Rhodoblastus sphagnicola]PPQ27935.1 sulfate adenylyltransferase subunit CysN [Rhodoblastus sphagnicola]
MTALPDQKAWVAPEAAPAAPEKALLRFITCGSVDDGKSTLIGRMLYDSQMIAEDQLEALDRDSKKFGTQGGALDFALLVDGLAAEREQGITIDVAYRYFKTDRRAFIVADTPGHEQYTRNMATGASTADLAIILIDARKGILPQTRRHSFIVSMIGVRDVALAINKMDLVDYSEARFNEIVAAYSEMAKGLGFRSITALPISALNGDNIATLSERTPWFQGEPLLPWLETIDAGSGELSEAPFRFPVQWVNRPNLDFRGFSGWVASGSIKPGDAIVALPSGRTSKVARIVTQDGDLPVAVAGQSVTLTLADEIDVSRGDILSSVERQPQVASSVEARLLWTAETNMHPGASYIVKLGARTANATVSKVRALIDIHTFEPAPGKPLALNEIAEAQLRFDRPFPIGLYRDNRDLGGFILIDRITNETVAFGMVAPNRVEVEPPAPEENGVDWARLGKDLGEKLLPALGGGVLIGLGAKLFGAPTATAVTLGLADAAFRPLVRGWYGDFRAALAKRGGDDEVTPDGAGI